jgi:hypothetical protein
MLGNGINFFRISRSHTKHSFWSCLDLRMTCILHQICIYSNINCLEFLFNNQHLFLGITLYHYLSITPCLPIFQSISRSLIVLCFLIDLNDCADDGVTYLSADFPLSHFQLPVDYEQHFRSWKRTYIYLYWLKLYFLLYMFFFEWWKICIGTFLCKFH